MQQERMPQVVSRRRWARRWMGPLSIVLSSTLLSSCVGLAVLAPHTEHTTEASLIATGPNQSPTIRPFLVDNRSDIIREFGEIDASQREQIGDIERITIDKGRQKCGVLLFVLPIYPKLCRDYIQFDLEGNNVIAEHRRVGRYYGLVCSTVFLLMGSGSYCVFFK